MVDPEAGIDLVDATTRLLVNDQLFNSFAFSLCKRVMAGTVPSVVAGLPQTGQESGN
jgi:hypothetical protein